MAETTSDFLIKRIGEWGIRRIYGYPGDGINGIIGAIDRAGDAIDYVQVRHEEMDAVPTPPRKHGTVHSGVGYAAPRVVPNETDLRRAADILNAGEKVAMLVGAGALHATDEVIEVAEILGAGVAKALLGKAVIPDDYPFVTGSIGLLGTKPSYDLMVECDTLLMVGSNFPYTEVLPDPGRAKGIQIDIDARLLSIRY